MSDNSLAGTYNRYITYSSSSADTPDYYTDLFNRVNNILNWQSDIEYRVSALNDIVSKFSESEINNTINTKVTNAINELINDLNEELDRKLEKPNIKAGTNISLTKDANSNDITINDTINLNGYATKTYVTDEINKASLSGTVDLSGYAKTADVNTSLSNKVDKIDGKGLSTNDYTTEEKTKVGKIKTDGTGKEFLANNGNYVGIYSKKEIDDLLYPILNPYKAPIVNLSASGTLFKVGTTNSVTFTANITKGRDDIKSIKFVNGTDTILKEITDKTELAKTTQTYTLSMTTTGTVKVIVNDGISAVEKSITVTYTYDSYYGIISANKTSLTSNEIKSLNKKLTIDKSFKYDKINLNNQKITYAYLKSRGALTKILDDNNFDYLNSYTRSEVNIDGQEYYLYMLTKATVIDGFKQIYQ